MKTVARKARPSRRDLWRELLGTERRGWRGGRTRIHDELRRILEIHGERFELCGGKTT